MQTTNECRMSTTFIDLRLLSLFIAWYMHWKTTIYMIYTTSNGLPCMTHSNNPTSLPYTFMVVDNGVRLYLQCKNIRVNSTFSNQDFMNLVLNPHLVNFMHIPKGLCLCRHMSHYAIECKAHLVEWPQLAERRVCLALKITLSTLKPMSIL